MNKPQAPKKKSKTLSERKTRIFASAEKQAPDREGWIKRNWFYYQDDERYMRFLVPEGLRVLDIGCGTGGLLAALRPSEGVGVDLSPRMIKLAEEAHPELDFRVGDIEEEKTVDGIKGPFDVIVMSDTVGLLEDCEQTLKDLHRLCAPETRLVLSYYSHLWEPAVRIAELAGGKMPQPDQNWLTSDDIVGILHLADFETVKREWRQLLPKHFLGLGTFINRYVATLPGIRRACLRNYIVARPRGGRLDSNLRASVIIPCRNERGNVEQAVKRLPKLSPDMEIVFVEGHSADDTFEEMTRVRDAYPNLKIKTVRQDGVGKADAVRKGFETAEGDVLMILDGDLTVRPEDMPKFYSALIDGKGELINGTRLVYPMEKGAMRVLNRWANRGFAWLFSWLLNQRFTDALCGTKVLTKKSYGRIAADRAYFGDFDPFGDFDLLIGASKQNLKIVELPVRYGPRTYGETQISRFSDGWRLLRMLLVAYRKLKAL